MKSRILLLLAALLGLLVPVRGQVVDYDDSNAPWDKTKRARGVVDYGDSNYMAIIYNPHPPRACAGDFGGNIFNHEIPGLEADYDYLMEGIIFKVDSVEHIYGIALTADTALFYQGGRQRNKSVIAGLYLYNVPRGTNVPILIDSIIVDCTYPYKRFVYHALDTTFHDPPLLMHDTVPVFERLFSREHVFGPNDSVLVVSRALPTPKNVDLVINRRNWWNTYRHSIWPGQIFFSRQFFNGVYTYDHSSTQPGPVFPIRHRECPKVEGVRVDSTDGTRVWISWPPAASATHYHLEYGPSGFKYGCGAYSEGLVVEVDGITGTSYCITSDRPDSLYTYFVSAYCSTMKQYGMPDSVRFSASDIMSCPQTADLRIEERIPYGVRLAWDTLPGQLEFQMYVRRDDTAALYLQPDSNPYVLTGLRDSILYTVMLRAQCQHLCPLHDTLIWSRWGHPTQFVLEGSSSGVEGVREVSGTASRFAVVPNPAHGSVTIVTEGLATAGGTITLTDAAGRTVASVPLVADRQPVDIATLTAGVYFVTLTTPQGSSSTKLAVE